MGNNTIKIVSKPVKDGLLLITSIGLFYGIQILSARYPMMTQLQIISLIPLLSISYFLFKLCSAPSVNQFMKTKVGICMRFFAGLCLEAYIVQMTIRPLLIDYLSHLFPYNLFIAFVIVITLSYITRCLGRVVSQIFEKEDMDWRAVVRLVD